ncbi:MAG: AAA family ATPase [Pseudomonadales bacterium]|nr:AAA family ATPase [Pseudomonadales bacterium]
MGSTGRDDTMESPTRRILVINGKGGCGKTTIATNLAVAYACSGTNVALMDNDPQGSSTYWASQRDPELPHVEIVAKHQRPGMYQTQAFHHRLPTDTEMIVVDGHSNARGRDLESLLRQTDIILVPILPSSIDIRAGGQFITDLLTHRLFRAAPRPVGVIANRIQPNTQTHDKLMNFLDCLDVPAVAQFRDSPVYTDAAEVGQGVVDMVDCRAARKETAQWKQLISWINEHIQPQSLARKAPKAAERKPTSISATSA